MFTGPRRLDGGVQSQQVGLAGDLLDDGDLGGEFSDNSITLLPGEPVTLTYKPTKIVTVEDLKKSLNVLHLEKSYR